MTTRKELEKEIQNREQYIKDRTKIHASEYIESDIVIQLTKAKLKGYDLGRKEALEEMRNFIETERDRIVKEGLDNYEVESSYHAIANFKDNIIDKLNNAKAIFNDASLNEVNK